MERLFKDLAVRKLGKGQIIIYEGDTINSIFWLSSGYVKVSNLLVDGVQRTIFIYTPGDAFPLTSFLSGAGVARYFYECMSDVEIKAMPQAEFQKLIKGNLEIGEELIAYTYRLNVQFVDRIETLSARRAGHKVAALLKYLAERVGAEHKGKIRLEIPLTTQEIANMCGLTRETTSVQLVKLKKAGIVDGRRYLVIDSQKITKLAEA